MRNCRACGFCLACGDVEAEEGCPRCGRRESNAPQHRATIGTNA